MRSAILVIHICGGVAGLLSGVAAVLFRKGSSRHAKAGNIFFISMLTMGSTAAYLGNVFGGFFSIYLVTTGWVTGKYKGGKTQTGIFDWGAVLFGLAIGVPIVIHGLGVVSGSIPPQPGVPIGMPLFIGAVVLLAVAGDVRMLVRGGISGRKRVARHLWRMCFGLFIATGSFLGQKRVVAFVGGPELFLILAPLPLVLMIFWLVRVRRMMTTIKSVPQESRIPLDRSA